MELHLYNTKSKKKEAFVPIDKRLVKLYVCGPTVYDYPHIGNARSMIIYDILYRVLCNIFGLNNVLYVRNITDVDDKIIERAINLKIKISELTKTTIYDFHSDMEYLRCIPPNIEPKATEHIQDMIAIIEKLIATDAAYIEADHVYFDITKCKNYTALSGRSIDEMFDSVRDTHHEFKRHKCDFVLWKPAANTQDIDANFNSPWGLGRPGWHIECSAMSYKYLGENFDIHGGGVDLIFPHHTNEIAQSTSAFANSTFCNYWVHNGFLTVNKEKMSKSLGNFITIKNLRDQSLSCDAVRLALLSTHYRKPLDFNKNTIANAEKLINYWRNAGCNTHHNKECQLPQNFMDALLDDMNTPLAIKIINDYAKAIYTTTDEAAKNSNRAALLACARFIGLMQDDHIRAANKMIDDHTIQLLINKRHNAKQDKNWALADQIRNELFEQGIILEDMADGTTKWR